MACARTKPALATQIFSAPLRLRVESRWVVALVLCTQAARPLEHFDFLVHVHVNSGVRRQAEHSVTSDPQRDAFPQTRPSVILAAQSTDPRERDWAVDAIASAYWRPIYKYLRVRWRVDREDARDFTQEFFTRLLEKDFLDAYDPAKGRLRTFLRT